MKMAFERACALIAAGFVFSSETYRLFPNHPFQQMLFAIRHCQDHIAKSFGAVAAVTETADHSGEMSDQAAAGLRLAACKQVVNALKLAEVVGLTPGDLEQYIQDKYG